MIKLNINRKERKVILNPQAENDLSNIIVAKNPSLRNYSLSTRNSKAINVCKPPIRNLSSNRGQEIDDKESSSRTFSVQDKERQHQPLLEKRLSDTNVNKPTLLPRPTRHQRKLVHIQTSPGELQIDRKPTLESQEINYDNIEIPIQETNIEILYRGFRNIQQLTKVAIVTYNLLYGQWNFQFFTKQNEQNKNHLVKQLLMRLKSECIIVLLLNPKQKLNSLLNNQIEQYDFIIKSKQINPKELLSYQKNLTNIWLNIDKLHESLKQNDKIHQYILIDQLILEQPIKLEPDNLQNKLLKLNHHEYVNNTQFLHIYLNNETGALSKFHNQIQYIIKQQSIQKEFKRLDMKQLIKHNIDIFRELQQKSKYISQVIDAKQKVKSHYQKQQENTSLQITPEQRVEKLRDQMIDYIKSKSKTKIQNMYFLIGDTIMRNFQFFKNQETEKYFSQKKVYETLQIIDHFSKKQNSLNTNNLLPCLPQCSIVGNYAFYYLN